MKVAYLGTRGGIEDPSAFTFEELSWIAGDNTGNFLFQHAAALLVQADYRYIGPPNTAFDDPDVFKDIDAVLFPAANHLSHEVDWTPLAAFIQKIDVPMAVLGMGAQADKTKPGADAVQTLAEDPILRILSDVLTKKVNLLTVRGPFSKAVAEAVGYENPIALGCPSLLISPDPQLGRTIALKLGELRQRVRTERVKMAMTAAAPFEIHSTPKADIEARMFEWLHKNTGVYIQQSGGPDALAMAAGEQRRVAVTAARSMWRVTAPFLPFDAFLDYMQAYARLFWHVKPWFEEVAKRELVIGTRFHGNMFGIAQGIPGVFITHDARTQELADMMRVPVASFDDVRRSEDIYDLLDRVSFDPDVFDANRRSIAQRLAEQLTLNGFRPSKHLLKLAGT